MSNPLYSQDLVYSYGGNISSQQWIQDGKTRKYTYTYDDLNRLTKAAYTGDGNYDTSYSYDKMGNITSLKRYDVSMVDNLTLIYNGNQLTKVEDAANNTFGFANGVNATQEYFYDANGNLTKDLNKNISNIQYNSLNLPSVVTFTDGSTVSYTYSAEGKKLRTVHVTNGATTTTDYCGNVIYENGTAKTLLTEAGYIDLSDNSHHFYIKDHLGNNRLVADASGNVKESNQYYPFGLLYANSNSNLQPYKYNGKELDAKAGLNWYDYGARHYDAALGRFMTQDRFAEKYSTLSPYQYAANSPVCNVDVNGDSIIRVDIIDKTRTIQGNSSLYIDHTIFEDVKNILTYVVENQIKIRLNSSFRTNKKQSGLNSSNATTPANPGRSPHNAGIGLDFNLYYEGQLDLGNKNVNSETPFIQEIKDMGWRWGGEFSKPDKIHMDKRGTEADFVKMRDENQKQMNGSFEIEALDKYIKRIEKIVF